MEKYNYLFTAKYKTVLIVLAILSVTFLDKIIPPCGIPVALVLIFVLIRWKKYPVKSLGLYNPNNWLKIISLGLLIAILVQLLGIYVLSPFFELFKGLPQADLSVYEKIEGNNSMLLIYLIVSWTTAGFGEELIFRGFIMEQIATVFKNNKFKWIFSLIITSILFGLIHYNNGITAIITTGFSGLIFGIVYLKTNRNLWACYFAHGFTDTIAFLIIYTGLYNHL